MFDIMLGKIPHAEGQLSLWATNAEPAATTEAWAPRACVSQEKPPQWENCMQLGSSSHTLQLEKTPCSQEDPEQPK